MGTVDQIHEKRDGFTTSDEITTIERCEWCDEELVLNYDEMKGDEASCAACEYVYRECGNCGSRVGESDWQDDIEMCKICWQAILDHNA